MPSIMCESLTNAIIPTSMTSIGDDAFAGMTLPLRLSVYYGLV